MATPVRQSVGFPTVANIHKGTPKRKIKKKYNGEEKIVEIMGLDLKNKFRIDFLPGTKDARATWHALHEKDYVRYPENFTIADGYEVEVLHARIPSTSVWTSWTWFNETYDQSGRLIAKADADHYITKKDPLTGELLIKDGQPYEKFNVGDVITYERKGRTVGLPMRSTGRLKLFLPELGQFVSFLLRTSSYIDSLFINEHLSAIQNVADFLNQGNAGAIPIDIYRVQLDSPWQKDGESHKGKQWFIQIEANKEWVRAAIERMNKFALGETVAGLLKPVDIPLDRMPESAFEETDDEVEQGANVVDVESVDVTPLDPELAYSDAQQVIVKVSGGNEKFMSELTVEQLNYLIASEKATDKQKEAAQIVLKHDFNLESQQEELL